METFWARLKVEIAWIRGSIWFATRAEAHAYLFEFIEVFYNRQRHQAGLSHLTPSEYADKWRHATETESVITPCPENRVKFTGTLRRVERVSINRRYQLIDRSEIYAGLAAKESGAAIARRLGVHPSTVTREIAANGGRDGYRPLAAHRRALRQRTSPTGDRCWTPILVWPATSSSGSPNCGHRSKYCEACRGVPRRSGDAGVARNDLPALYVQGRGGLRKELTTICGPDGRSGATRSTQRRGQEIPGMIKISERPAEVETAPCPVTGKAT